MIDTTTARTPEHRFHSPVWYQDEYFMSALQHQIDRARSLGTPLSVVILRVPGCSRRIARTLYAYAEAEDRRCFFGLLANGDYALALPGRGYPEAIQERLALSRDMAEFEHYSGLAVLDWEGSAAELLSLAARDCSANARAQSAGAAAA